VADEHDHGTRKSEFEVFCNLKNYFFIIRWVRSRGVAMIGYFGISPNFIVMGGVI